MAKYVKKNTNPLLDVPDSQGMISTTRDSYRSTMEHLDATDG